jgi:hypothetical protein
MVSEFKHLSENFAKSGQEREKLEALVKEMASEFKHLSENFAKSGEEREKLESLLEQQKQCAATSAAEACARELELKKNIDLVRTHAAEELAVVKQDAQRQLEQALASLSAAEEELAASHESALAMHDQVAAQLESCMREASKAEQQLAGAVVQSNMQQQALMAERANRISAAQHSQTEAGARLESLALALSDDAVHLVRMEIVEDPEGFFERAVADSKDETISRGKFTEMFDTECNASEEAILESAKRLFDQLDTDRNDKISRETFENLFAQECKSMKLSMGEY